MAEEAQICFDENVTIGEKYEPAMTITDQTEADDYFEACVQHCMKHGKSREEAESIERQSLGHYAGYFDKEIWKRVFRLFHCVHPVFGKTYPTVKEAMSLGLGHGENDND